jgi:NTE family protein
MWLTSTRQSTFPRCLLILFAALLTMSAIAQETDSAVTMEKHRPRIALVLAGGGARGGAHVGVLKVLEDLRVPVDCIAGTSMGALVGGGYASGMPARQIELFLERVNWRSVLGGVGGRGLEPIEQKRFNDVGGGIELGLKGKRIVAPSGLIPTSRIENVLRAYVARARSVPDFDQLPIPFRAVATDLLSGNMVVLDRGDVATAMRASMAIPGVFAPVVTDQHVLADGFVVRNLPVDVGRALCGDVVIAVNLAKPPVTRDQLVGLGRLTSRSYDVMSETSERQQLELLTQHDIRIDVDVRDIGPGDFEAMPATIAKGVEAARAAAQQLEKLSLSEAEYASWRHSVTVQQSIETRIADVRFEGLKHVNPDYLRTLTSIRAGDTVDVATISQDAARMAGLEDLEGVGYRLAGDADDQVLVWQPQEQAIGPGYLRPSIGLYAAGAGDVRFDLGLRYVRRWLNSYGAQWRNEIHLGFNTLLATSLYQPLNVAQTIFIEPYAELGRSLEYVYNNYERVAQYRFIDLGGRMDMGLNLSPSAQVRVGYWVDRRRTQVDTGIATFPTTEGTDAGLVTTALYDTRDASTFPHTGLVAQMRYLLSNATLGADRGWDEIEGAVRKVISAGKTTLWVTAAGGSDFGSSMPADRAFSLGGPQSFPGYAQGEVRARGYWTVETNALWRVQDILRLANQALYAGVGLQAAGVYDRVDPVSNGKLFGVSGFIGGRTPLGAVTIGAGKATGAWAVWLTVGVPVGSGSILNEPTFR